MQTALPAIARLREILRGIDCTEVEDPAGWWETSTGAGFGAQKLREVESFLGELLAEKPADPKVSGASSQAAGSPSTG